MKIKTMYELKDNTKSLTIEDNDLMIISRGDRNRLTYEILKDGDFTIEITPYEEYIVANGQKYKMRSLVETDTIDDKRLTYIDLEPLYYNKESIAILMKNNKVSELVYQIDMLNPNHDKTWNLYSPKSLLGTVLNQFKEIALRSDFSTPEMHRIYTDIFSLDHKPKPASPYHYMNYFFKCNSNSLNTSKRLITYIFLRDVYIDISIETEKALSRLNLSKDSITKGSVELDILAETMFIYFHKNLITVNQFKEELETYVTN